MKTTILKSIFAVIIMALCLISCNNNKEVASPPPPIGLPEFLYAEGGVTSMSSVANSVAKESTKEILGKNGTTSVVEIKLTSFAVGTYTIGSGNQFKYMRPSSSSTWTAILGTITITANFGNKLTGNFNLTAGNSDLGINSVSGSFTDIEIVP
jgi:uncharacterized lipoprotein NlpE involved in copper resistance